MAEVIGFALSGGGAKGSFQLGALAYLYRRAIRPQIIAGTSVGAINTAKLAEGEISPDHGFAGLERIWLELVTESDMYVENPEVGALPKRVTDAVTNAMIGASVGGPLGLLFGGVLFPWILGDPLEADVRAAVHSARRAGSFYQLTPIEGRLRGTPPWRPRFDLAAARSSGIKAVVTAVGLASGKLRYIDQHGRVFENDDLQNPVATDVDFVDAIIASAAMPAIFAARELLGELHVDGGVREIVPVRAALKLGAQRIYAIVCSPSSAPQQRTEHETIDGVASRAIDLLTDEVVNDELVPRPPWSWGVPVHIIRPRQEVHDSKRIDPGLIRINIAYGWMRAFDMVDDRLGPAAREHAANLAEEITRRRVEIWRLEQEAVARNAALAGGIAGATMLLPEFETLRRLKCEVRSLVEKRRQVAGEFSMPRERDWWQGWEGHSSPPPWPSPWGRIEVQPPTPSPRLGPERPEDPPVVTPAPVLVSDAEQPCPEPITLGDDDLRFIRHRGASQPTGAYIQSDHGTPGDHELVVVRAGKAVHFTRASDVTGFPWRERGPLPQGGDAILIDRSQPTLAPRTDVVTASMMQRASADGDHGDFEVLLHLRSALGQDDWLALTTFDASTSSWRSPVPITVEGSRISGVTGRPAFLQSDWGNAGNYEMIVPQGGRLVHYWRDMDAPGRPWHTGSTLPMPSGDDGILGIVALEPDAVAFIQTNMVRAPHWHGTYEVVARMSSPSGESRLAHWSLDVASGSQWQGPIAIVADGEAVRGTLGRPALVQSDFGGAQGNFELLVPKNGRVAHLWRDNSIPSRPWHAAADLPMTVGDTGSLAALQMDATSVAMFSSRSRSRDGASLWQIGHLEAVVRMQAPIGGQSHIVSYTFTAANMQWRSAGLLRADGEALTGIDEF